MTEYVILLSFLVGLKPVTHTLPCPNWRCVANVVAHAHESRHLGRLRVFRQGDGALLPSGNSVFPPLLDLHFQ